MLEYFEMNCYTFNLLPNGRRDKGREGWNEGREGGESGTERLRKNWEKTGS